jgi:hypothetical protein
VPKPKTELQLPIALDSLPRVTTGAHQGHQDLQNVEPKLLHLPLLSTRRRNIADHEDPSRPSSRPKAQQHRQPLDPLRLGILQTNQDHHENTDVEQHPFRPFLSQENCKSTIAQWNRADLLRHPPYTVSTKIRLPPLTSATGEHISATSSFSSLFSHRGRASPRPEHCRFWPARALSANHGFGAIVIHPYR